MLRRRHFLGAALVAGAGVALGGAGVAAGCRRSLRASLHRVPSPGPRLRLVQLSDLHIGRATPHELLRSAVRSAVEARADLCVLTGDYLNHSLAYLPRLEELAAALPRPCVAVLGNHDHWSGAEAIQRALERHRILVLRNSHVTLVIGGQQVTVVGVDDGRSGHADVERAFSGVIDPQRAIALTHYPKDAPGIIARGARLVLAGHTHGGEIAIPRLTPALARLGGLRHLSGWYPVGEGRLYVSPGLGSAVVRLRLGQKATPEIAVMDLV